MSACTRTMQVKYHPPRQWLSSIMHHVHLTHFCSHVHTLAIQVKSNEHFCGVPVTCSNQHPLLQPQPSCSLFMQTMTWDDHDIFDGWGSYPDGLQNCPVFQGCYQAAKRFYLLFQQHTTEARVSQLSDMFGHR